MQRVPLRPDIRFCTAAYGSGPPLVRAGTWLTHVVYDATSPLSAHWGEKIAVLVTLVGSHMLDGLALFGVRQVLAYFRGRALPSLPFRTPGLYRLARHPMMTGMLMTFWAGPTMTQGRLLLAAAMTGYILAAVKWLEERDLRKAFGTEYERYEREVPMLLPLRVRRRSPKGDGRPGTRPRSGAVTS
ncbi:MAG: methanethiol S-methyltransferase [Myxococcales bacterium]|nr:methanethiol S-methyltransferase [Myxococcales bacterium]